MFSFHVYLKTYCGCYIINGEMCYSIQGDIFHLWIWSTKDICTIERHSQVMQACTEAPEGLNLCSCIYFRAAAHYIILKELTNEMHLL